MDSHGDMALATPMKASGSIDSSTDVHAGRKRKVRMTGAERDQLLENLDIEGKQHVVFAPLDKDDTDTDTLFLLFGVRFKSKIESTSSETARTLSFRV
jgi:hypothetical protein